MRPDPAARREYVAAFRAIVTRIASTLGGTGRRLPAVRMYGAGGAAMHFYTGELVSEDVDAAVLEVQLLSPVDLAVSKISRLSDQDRGDIVALVRRGLVDAKAVRQWAEQALGGFVGNLGRVRNSIDIVVRILDDTARVTEK
ncbi:MAG: DUF6036 family nucleotidyltransferase [Candidatus Binatia bacterium]